MSLYASLHRNFLPYAVQANIYLSHSRVFNAVASYTGISQLKIAFGLYLLITLSLFLNPFGCGAPLAANLVSLVYPAHSALRSAVNSNEKHMRQWTIYFIVFGIVVTLIDPIGSYYIPYYYAFKAVGFVSLFWSSSSALELIYQLLLPLISPYYLDKSD